MARALVEPAKLLFLDDPTGAMDNQTENLFIDHLEKALETDQTLIVSTHRNALLRIVDRLIVIDQGVVLADGPRDAIIGQLQRGAGQWTPGLSPQPPLPLRRKAPPSTGGPGFLPSTAPQSTRISALDLLQGVALI